MVCEIRIRRFGDLTVNALPDINLVSDDAPPLNDLGASLKVVSIVEISLVPLWLAAGPSARVWSRDEKTLLWFSDMLLQQPVPSNADDGGVWIQAKRQSYCGILAKVIPSPA